MQKPDNVYSTGLSEDKRVNGRSIMIRGQALAEKFHTKGCLNYQRNVDTTRCTCILAPVQVKNNMDREARFSLSSPYDLMMCMLLRPTVQWSLSCGVLGEPSEKDGFKITGVVVDQAALA